VSEPPAEAAKFPVTSAPFSVSVPERLMMPPPEPFGPPPAILPPVMVPPFSTSEPPEAPSIARTRKPRPVAAGHTPAPSRLRADFVPT
jgi:hypothetical protein